MNEDNLYEPFFRFLETDFAGNRTEYATDPVLIESGPKRKGMILPFQPLTMTFHNVDYFVDMPKVITFFVASNITYQNCFLFRGFSTI